MENCKRFNRLLSLVLAFVMVFSMLPMPRALAAEDGTTLYLKPNSNWVQASARFAVYYWTDSGDAWIDMTDADGDGYYEAVVPTACTGLIFCRMDPSAAENNWNNKWNQSADLTVPTGGTNCYTVAEDTWDKGGGTWSAYTPSTEEPEETSVSYYVAGVPELCGVEWDPAAQANKMSDADGDGVYELVYEDVAAGTYSLKVTDGTWDNTWGKNGNNLTFEVSAVCDVTVTFDSGSKTVAVSGDNVSIPTGLEITSMHAVGNGSGNWLNGKSWDVSSNAMTETSAGVYEITFKSVPAGDAYEFKFAANVAWTDSWGNDNSYAVVGETAAANYNGQNIKLKVPYELADVTLKLDMTGYDHSTTSGATYTVTMEEVEIVDYYLVGYINGANYGCQEDYENLGEYKFVDGKLTATFTSDSYVFVKTGDNANWYMSEGYAEASPATLYNTSVGLTNADKLFVPGGVELSFTLVENEDGSLTLSYMVVSDTVTIHFAKPDSWGSTINAYLWTADGALAGYEAYNAWPGKAVSQNSETGFYDLVVAHEGTTNFNFIFNDGANQTADLTTGEVTGTIELWVVNGEVLTEKPWYTAHLHFQKPDDWADTINAWIWNDSGKIPGYEDYNTTWPGKAVAADPDNAGWYNVSVTVESDAGFSFIFNDGTNQTSGLKTEKLSFVTNLWIVNGEVQTTAPEGWFDASRKVYVPGTFPGPSWDAASNQMTYDKELGLYVITFENVAKGTYEYKIAINGSWGENYGANGEADGDNMKVVVPTAQDVTIWYNDNSHRTACSVYYDPGADITLSGTGIAEGTKLTDPELTGTFSVTVTLDAGTYSDLKVTYDGKDYCFTEFTMETGKDVTFWFDPSTGLAYHNGSDVKVETENIYYTTKDLEYKSPFGAVATGEEVTFSIDTGLDATAVNLIVKGYPAVGMEKAGESEDGVQRWTCTTTFDSTGEYEYYFAVTNGSDMVFYCDDIWNSYYKTGDYGEGGIGNADDIFAYDLVVYKAGYETPDWMKNAVIYQIFPDRFFDGDETNNKAQTWARGTVDYEYITDWYTWPENPEQSANAGYPENAYVGDGQWSNEIYGGDLKGITERIDYLKALGVNVIYLNPVFWSISNHRYDAVSYTEIDPILGTLGDFEELVAVAEANGMHIILDGVFNHVSDDSVYFDRYYKFLPDAAEKYDGHIGAYPYWAYVYDTMAAEGITQDEAEAKAKTYFSTEYGITDYSYTEWFAVSSNTMAGSVDKIGLRAGKEVYSYEGWWGYDSMPVIYSTNGSEYQTGNWAEEIISGSNSVNAYWIGKGMDGWRLDVANEVSDETWQNFRDSVKALDSDAVIIGEIWADSTRYLLGDMYDSVMNYVFRDAVAGFARGYLINRDNKTEKYDSDLIADEAMTILEILRERYPEEAFYAMMNLVGSHDTSRILSYLDDVEDDRYQKDMASAFPTYETTSDRAKQLQHVVSFLQFTYAGAPTIYYGDEIGMVGGDDPDDRRAFEWGKGNQELVEWYSTLAAIREQYPALRTGSVEAFSSGNDDVMSFVRRDSADTLVVLANRAASAATVTLDLAELGVNAETLTDVLTGTAYTAVDGVITVSVDAYRGAILAVTAKTYAVNTAALAPAYDPAYIVPERSAEPHVHDWADATCTEPKTCKICGETEGEALGHKYEDGKCIVCGETDPDYVESTVEGLTRIFGGNRYETALAVADQLKQTLGGAQFSTVVVAYGGNYPDALSGSYLAIAKNAPMLLTDASVQEDVTAWIVENLEIGGLVYVLGGENAVPADFDAELKSLNFNVERLAGDTRIETNLAILEEAGVTGEQDLLICTAMNYADSLSASATGLPILLVSDTLTDAQKALLENHTGKKVIVGGEKAVSADLAEVLGVSGEDRLAGATRYETSVLVAERYFSNAEVAVLAYALNYPDGLSGSTLAAAMKAPLILTDDKHPEAADAYVENAAGGYILGGETLIGDDTAKNIFDLPEDAVITVK